MEKRYKQVASKGIQLFSVPHQSQCLHFFLSKYPFLFTNLCEPSQVNSFLFVEFMSVYMLRNAKYQPI